MNVKDRHNRNFLISRSGFLVMVNFEYILQKSPLINLEQAHFKMTQEFIDLIGTRYTEFVKLLI